MSGEHRVSLHWTGGEAPFTPETYPRNHQIVFKDGKQAITASAAPGYRGDGVHADPEEMLVAALSSCHMLSFLAIAAKKKLTVESYTDEAVGYLENEGGKLWITKVILRPQVTINADPALLAEIHHLAHQACFIANSVKTDVAVEPR